MCDYSSQSHLKYDLSQFVCPHAKCTLRGPWACKRCDWNDKPEEA
jgi:hypothetical protein